MLPRSSQPLNVMVELLSNWKYRQLSNSCIVFVVLHQQKKAANDSRSSCLPTVLAEACVASPPGYANAAEQLLHFRSDFKVTRPSIWLHIELLRHSEKIGLFHLCP